MLVNYNVSHELYLYKSPNNFRTINTKSKYINTFRYEQKDYFRQYITDGFYFDMQYDKFRNLYYRIVKHLQPIDNSDGTSNGFFDAPWSVIVLDADLNIIDEISFASKEYVMGRIIITKSGLLLTKRIQKGLFEKEELQNIIYRLELNG